MTTTHLKPTLVQPATTPEHIRAVFDGFSLSEEGCDDNALHDFLKKYAQNAVDSGSSKPVIPAKYHMYGPTDEVALSLYFALSAQAPEGIHQLPSTPITDEVGEQVLTWFCESIYGVGTSAKGVFNDSGSALNISALVAALHRNRAASRLAEHEDEVVLVSEAAHYSSDTAANVTGLGFDQVLKIRDTPDGALDLEHLGQLLEDCDRPDEKGRVKVPRMIVITVGTSVSGRIEPIRASCALVTAYNNRHPERPPIWVHVDGCFGGPYAFLSSYSSLYEGISDADSVGIDMHKTIPGVLTSAALFFKNPEDAAFTKSLWPRGKNPYVAAALCTAAYLARVGTDGFLDHLTTFMNNAEIAREAIKNSYYLVLINETDPKTPIVNFKYKASVDVLVAAAQAEVPIRALEKIDNLARELMANLGLAAYNKGTVTTNGTEVMVYRPSYVNRYETPDQIKMGIALISRVYSRITAALRVHLRRGESFDTFSESNLTDITYEDMLSGFPLPAPGKESDEIPVMIESLFSQTLAPASAFKIKASAEPLEKLMPHLREWVGSFGPLQASAIHNPILQGQLMTLLFKGSLAAFRSSPVESEIESAMMQHYGKLSGFCDASGNPTGEGAYFHNPLLVALLTARNHLTINTDLPLQNRGLEAILLLPNRDCSLTSLCESVALQIGIRFERLKTSPSGEWDVTALRDRLLQSTPQERFIVAASLRTALNLEDPLVQIRQVISDAAPGKVDFHVDLSEVSALIYNEEMQHRLRAAKPDSLTFPELIVHRDKTILAKACSPKGGSYLLEAPEDRGTFMISCGRSGSEPMRDFLRTKKIGLTALRKQAELCH